MTFAIRYTDSINASEKNSSAVLLLNAILVVVNLITAIVWAVLAEVYREFIQTLQVDC
jgi:hypothetical protein